MSKRAMLRETRPTRGYCGVAVYLPKTQANVGSLWRSASAFGASFLATIGRRYERQASDTGFAAKSIPLWNFPTMADLLEHLPDSCPLVGVELDPRATPLGTYIHRERAVYLLGAEDHGIPTSVLDQCHDLVQIPTVTPWSINLACAGSILLSNRHLQRTQRLSVVPKLEMS